MNYLAIVQARVNSSRLPYKVIRKINRFRVIEILLKRLSMSKKVDKIVVSTTKKKSDDELVLLVKKNKFGIFRGNENDVLDRFYKTALKFKAKNIVRITADCPLVDPMIVDQIIELHKKSKKDLTSNCHIPTYPDGLDVEVFTFDSLKNAWKKSTKKDDREHVTPYIKRNSQINILKNKKNFSHLRLTIDEHDDLELVTKIVNYFKPKINFSLKDILRLYSSNKNLFKINKNIQRDEGRYLTYNDKLWKSAKSIIPGGNMFYSKRPEAYVDFGWPTYFKKAKGCKIWSLENKVYHDLSYMGVGTNVLGYGNSKVDAAIKKVIERGNMTTLNAYEDVILANKLLKINPWADMAKFARTGGEANAVAMRIARASTKKNKVAICGYHGWHDWYMASYINPKNKKNFFKDNNKIKGIPKSLSKTIFTFPYNDISQLKRVINKNKDIGIIKMEVERNIKPKKNFLKEVRQLADKKNIILIFDECTSGFRQTFGGLHSKYGVEPDIVIYGKAIGNGYPINAILGKRKFMKKAESSFISSTFWSERVGTTAAIATLNEMERLNSAKRILDLGIKVKKKLRSISKLTGLKIEISGLDSMPMFKLKNKNEEYQNFFKIFITKEMLKKNFLATNTIYLSLAHKKEILNKYFRILKNIFYKFKHIKKPRNYTFKIKQLNRLN